MRFHAVAVAALTACLVLAAVTYEPRQPEPLSPAAQLAVELDGLLDGVAEPVQPVSNELLIRWTFEILPYFEYEGVTGRAVAPSEVRLTPYLEAMEHSHILGRAYCTEQGGGPVEINARVGNPVSSWYGRPGFLATLVHELGHVQGGGLCSGDSAELESTTQIVTLEVLASMAAAGNKLALYVVLDELRDMAMGAVHFDALKAGRMSEFRAFAARVYSDPVEQSRMAKSARRWEHDQGTLREILFKYSKVPMVKVLRGLKKGAGVVEGLRLVATPSYGFSFVVPDNAPRGLIIDDLVYVLEHADELLGGKR
jgi:hypothetical protein